MELLESLPAEPSWAQEWDAGLADADPLSPFLARSWLAAWRESYGRGLPYRLILATRSGQLQAALPLVAERMPISRFTVGGMRYASSPVTGRTGPWLAGMATDALADILRASAGFTPGWVVCEIPDVVSGSSAHQALLSAAGIAGIRVRTTRGRASPFVECAESFSAWLATRSRNIRSNRNRKLNRLTREGSVEFVECLGNAAVHAVLSELFAVSRASWKGRLGTDMAGSEASAQFFTRLASASRCTHDLDAWLLKVAGRTVAMQLYWGNGFRRCLLRTDFHESEAALSPGDVLQLYVIERYHDMGVREIDLGGQSYDYKLRLTSCIREHVSLRLHRPGLAGRLVFFGSRLAGHLRRKPSTVAADEGG